jgi:hypothetical protein
MYTSNFFVPLNQTEQHFNQNTSTENNDTLWIYRLQSYATKDTSHLICNDIWK